MAPYRDADICHFRCRGATCIEPDEFGLVLIGREENRSEVVVCWSGQSIEGGEGCTRSLWVGQSECGMLSSSAGVIASTADTSLALLYAAHMPNASELVMYYFGEGG